MLLFTQFKNGFFQGATFINCFRIFKWIVRESLLHKVHGVHKQTGIGVQINNLKTWGVEITLIQCCFNVTTLKQCGPTLFLLRVCRVFVWKRTKKTFTMRCKGEIWVKLQNFLSLHFIYWNFQNYPNLPFPLKHLWIVVWQYCFTQTNSHKRAHP